MNWRIRIVTNAKKLNNQNDLIPETLYLAGGGGGVEYAPPQIK